MINSVGNDVRRHNGSRTNTDGMRVVLTHNGSRGAGPVGGVEPSPDQRVSPHVGNLWRRTTISGGAESGPPVRDAYAHARASPASVGVGTTTGRRLLYRRTTVTGPGWPRFVE